MKWDEAKYEEREGPPHELAPLLASFTCRCLDRGLQVERTWALEALDDFLAAWVSLVLHPMDPKPPHLLSCLERVFSAAVLAHFASSAQTALEEEDEYEDRDQLVEYLVSLSAIGRCHLSSSLALVAQQLGQRVARLQALFQGKFAAVKAPEDAARLLQLQDELYWLVLVATHLLTDDTSGEEPQVPHAIEAYSDRCAAAQLPNLLLKLVDAVVQLAVYSARILKIASSGASLPDGACSFLVLRTLLAFFRRFAAAYFLRAAHDDAHYSIQPNPQLLAHYRDPQVVAPLACNLAALVFAVFSQRPSLDDPPLVLEASRFLHVLASTRDLPQLLLRGDAHLPFLGLLASAAQGKQSFLAFFPSKARIQLVATLLSLSHRAPDVLPKAIGPLVQAFCDVAQHLPTEQGAQLPAHLMQRVVLLTDCARGIPMASTPRMIAAISKLSRQQFAPILALLARAYQTKPLPFPLVKNLHKLIRDIVVFQIELVDSLQGYFAFVSKYSQLYAAFVSSSSFSLAPQGHIGRREHDEAVSLLCIYMETLHALSHPQIWSHPNVLVFLFKSVHFLLGLCRPSDPSASSTAAGGGSRGSDQVFLSYPTATNLLSTIIAQVIHPRSMAAFFSSPEPFLRAIFGFLGDSLDNPVFRISEMAAHSVATLISALVTKSDPPSLIEDLFNQLLYRVFHKVIFGSLPLGLVDPIADALYPLFSTNSGRVRSLMTKVLDVCKTPQQVEMLKSNFGKLLEPPGPKDPQKIFRLRFSNVLNFVRPICR